MTTIVMVEKQKTVDIAWDSQVSSGYGGEELEQEKVFEASGIIYGVAGAVRVANLIEGLQIKPPTNLSDKDTDTWVSRYMIPRIQQTLREHGALEQDQYMEAGILAVVNARVYSIGGDFSRVRNTSGRYVLGSGSNYAKGALDAGASAEQAVKVAAKNDVWTGFGIKTATVRK